MRSGPYSAITCFVNSGFLRATEPRITRLTPISKYKSTASLSRIPPPISNTPVNAARTHLTISTLTGFPAFAPSKSTRCKAPTPAASYRDAWSTGSGLMMVSFAKSPLYRRTLRPSCKSIAGKIIVSPLFTSLMWPCFHHL